jgi:hypothetical protein
MVSRKNGLHSLAIYRSVNLCGTRATPLRLLRHCSFPRLAIFHLRLASLKVQVVVVLAVEASQAAAEVAGRRGVGNRFISGYMSHLALYIVI